MRNEEKDISYSFFKRDTHPRIKEIYLQIYRENRDQIKVKNEEIAIKNLEVIYERIFLNYRAAAAFDCFQYGDSSLNRSIIGGSFSIMKSISSSVL